MKEGSVGSDIAGEATPGFVKPELTGHAELGDYGAVPYAAVRAPSPDAITQELPQDSFESAEDSPLAAVPPKPPEAKITREEVTELVLAPEHVAETLDLGAEFMGESLKEAGALEEDLEPRDTPKPNWRETAETWRTKTGAMPKEEVKAWREGKVKEEEATNAWLAEQPDLTTHEELAAALEDVNDPGEKARDRMAQVMHMNHVMTGAFREDNVTEFARTLSTLATFPEVQDNFGDYMKHWARSAVNLGKEEIANYIGLVVGQHATLEEEVSRAIDNPKPGVNPFEHFFNPDAAPYGGSLG